MRSSHPRSLIDHPSNGSKSQKIYQFRSLFLFFFWCYSGTAPIPAPTSLLYPVASFKKRQLPPSQVFLPAPFSPLLKSRVTPPVLPLCISSIAGRQRAIATPDSLLQCCRCFHRCLRSPEPPPQQECHSRGLVYPPHRRQPSPMSLRHPLLVIWVLHRCSLL
jgi:hypothetical protein